MSWPATARQITEALVRIPAQLARSTGLNRRSSSHMASTAVSREFPPWNLPLIPAPGGRPPAMLLSSQLLPANVRPHSLAPRRRQDRGDELRQLPLPRCARDFARSNRPPCPLGCRLCLRLPCPDFRWYSPKPCPLAAQSACDAPSAPRSIRVRGRRCA